VLVGQGSGHAQQAAALMAVSDLTFKAVLVEFECAVSWLRPFGMSSSDKAPF